MTTDHHRNRSASGTSLLQSALDQFREEYRLHEEAVESYNEHLDNHRDRRDLHELPAREPVAAHDAYEPALDGDPAAIDALLTHLIDRAHLDSQVRRHPRTYPVHVEAVEHLEIARDQLVGTLEEAFRHSQATDD